VATSWTTVAVSAALAVAVSPLLASWSAALADGDTGDWWRPRRVDTARLAIVAAAALTFGALAGGGGPLPAWWLIGGNDVGFSSVMEDCVLYGTSTCVSDVKAAENTTEGSTSTSARAGTVAAKPPTRRASSPST
jgi:hypothetical protein